MTKEEFILRTIKANNGMTAFEKGKYIKSIFPSLADNIIKEAENALNNQLILPGTNNKLFFVGNPTKWRDNPTGNAEFTFQLNRMVFLKTLSEAYAITGEEKYSQKVIFELDNWIHMIKRPDIYDNSGDIIKSNFDGPQSGPWRALEVGIRCYRTLPIILELISESINFTQNFFEEIQNSIKEHMEILYYVSPFLWPNADHNHYLMENLGLYTMSIMFPDLDPEKKYFNHSRKELNRCMDIQCTEEGGQIEGCPSYHNGSVYWFSLKNNVENHFNLPIDKAYTSKIRKMFDHSLYATRNIGGNIPWGDSHTTPVETCSIAAVGCYLATGENIFLKNALHFISKEILENDLTFNLFRIIDLKKFKEDYSDALQSPVAPNLPMIHYAKSLNQFYARTGWNKEDFTFMTACRTPVKNLHAHMDPCSFDFSAYGDVLVADPGIYTYKSGKDRYRFKSTLSHSTISINKKDAWEYIDSWAYGPQKDGRISSVEKDEDSIKITMEHYNYAPIKIKRIFYLVKSLFIIVLDVIDNITENDEAFISYHLDTKKIKINSPKHFSTEKGSNAELEIIMSNTGKIEIESGKISDRNEEWRDSTILRFIRSTKEKHIVNATLLIPRKKEDNIKEAYINLNETPDNISMDIKIDNSNYSFIHTK